VSSGEGREGTEAANAVSGVLLTISSGSSLHHHQYSIKLSSSPHLYRLCVSQVWPEVYLIFALDAAYGDIYHSWCYQYCVFELCRRGGQRASFSAEYRRRLQLDKTERCHREELGIAAAAEAAAAAAAAAEAAAAAAEALAATAAISSK
jgi:hypothetical protein